MSWQLTIDAIYVDRVQRDDRACRPRYCPPATEEALAAVERELRVVLPASLRRLLAESNGVMNTMSVAGGPWLNEDWLIWPIELILEENQWLRSMYDDRNLNRYVFFSSAGVDGIMYGFSHSQSSEPDFSVYAWYPDDTPDKHLGDGLESFVRGAICGGIVL